MRYSEAHAAKSGSVPFALRGPKSVRMVLATAVAGAIGLVPAVAVSTPAFANGPFQITPSNGSVTEGGDDTIYTIKNVSGSLISGITASAIVDLTEGANSIDATGDVTVTPTSSFSLADGASKQITVHAVDDSKYEAAETFRFDVKQGDNDYYANGVVYDNDSQPSYTLTATPATVSEKSSGDPLPAKITATLSAKSGVDTVVKLSTEDGTAKVGDDYKALDAEVDKNTQITVPAGSFSASVNVYVRNDGIKDAASPETFKVNGSADNATPSDQSATVSIVDAQSTPVLTLTQDAVDGAQDEGKDVKYTVTATPASEVPITVRWDAVAVTPDDGDDAATPGQDFAYSAPATRTVTIPAQAESADFTISLRSDGLNENHEQFGVQLAAPTNATIDDKDAMVTTTINDGDSLAVPTVSFTPTSVTEGSSGKVTKTFTATLSQKSGRTVSVDWTTATPGSGAKATPGKDYTAKKGTLVFPPGTTSQTFTVDIVGDTTHEDNEVFNIELLSADHTADIGEGDSPVPVTITDDDAKPTVTFDNVTMKEGEATVPVMMQIKLSNPTKDQITFTVSDDSGGGAGIASDTSDEAFDPDVVGEGDYTRLVDTVTIQPGQTVGYVPVLVNGDAIYESDETASILATAADSTLLGIGSGTKTAKLVLQNDDKAPTLAIDSVAASEGDTVGVTGTVQGSTDQDSNFNITVAGGSVNGSKAADSKDFSNPGPLTATIPAGAMDGDTVTIGDVGIVDDADSEGAETIVVSGSPQSGSQGAVVSGAITIAASDGGATTPPVTPTITVPANVVGAVAVPITGKATAGQDVELWGAPISSAKPALVKLQTLKAGTNGAYAFSRWIGSGYRFAIKVGTWSSPEKQVTVTQDPILVASTTKGLASFAVQGSPRAAGQTVIVQRYVNGKWGEIARGLTGSTNQWKGSVKIASGTAVAVRAFVVGDTTMGIMGGYSDIKRFTIK